MIDLVIDARPTKIGDLEIGRVLPFHRLRMVGPFIFFDHALPARLRPSIPRSADVRPHPHIGLSTITYVFAGEMMHRDSLGYEQIIRPGDVNWMKAGRGISHSERFEEPFRSTGGDFELFQIWAALPAEDEEVEPSFQHVGADALPSWRETGLSGRLIVGSAFGFSSPVKVTSPLFYVHLELADDALFAAPDNHDERAIYIRRGAVEIGGQVFGERKMLVLSKGASPRLRAIGATSVVILGGEGLGPRHIWWNFVSSRKERIDEAKADWASGRIPLPLRDNKEFIPLPEEK